MIVAKERAEHLAGLSYKFCKAKNKMDELITYKKAMEFDENTAEDIIRGLEEKLISIDMESYLRNLGFYANYYADELLEIDNYQYVDSYEYNYNGTTPSVLTVHMHEGESFSLSSLSHKIYTQHIYEDLLPNKEDGMPILKGGREWELFLKLMIIEDRLINPYRIYKDIPGAKLTYTFLPMKETLKWLNGYSDEIEIINKVLAKTNGKLIKGYNSQRNIAMEIKPTVLYLETIGEDKLAHELRKHQNNELHLNYVLERANKSGYGLVAMRKNTSLVLL